MKKLLFILILFCSLQGFGQIKGYWRLDGNSNDASGNGNNGTDANITYSQSNGRLNKGAGFNGSSSKIDIPSTVSGLIPNMTISAWIKTTTINTGHIITKRSSVSVNGQFDFYVQSGKIKFYDYDTNYRFITASNKSVNDGFWHCVQFVKIGGTSAYMYVDGVLDSQFTGTNVNYSSSILMSMGYDRRNNAEFYDGVCDEVIIDNTAWNTARIKNEYIRMLGFFAMLEKKELLEKARINKLFKQQFSNFDLEQFYKPAA